jgi:hypothetical protein
MQSSREQRDRTLERFSRKIRVNLVCAAGGFAVVCFSGAITRR